MSRQLTYAVVADSGTDRLLVPIIEWAIHRLDPQVEILEPEFSKRHGPVGEFLDSYDPSTMLIFCHRDSENQTVDQRMREFSPITRRDVVPVIPVRMSEAWILFDGAAISQAAGLSGNGVTTPRISDLENLSDPKQHLDELLLTAAGNPSGRRGRNFKRSIIERRVSVASLISDYSPLEGLPAFHCFQRHLRRRYPYQSAIVR